MIRNITLIALGAMALAACNPEPENIVADRAPDPMADALANAPAIELPAAILKTKIYRCKDNGLVSIDWLADKKSANLRVGEATTPTQLKAAVEGEAMTAADGTSLTGDAAAASISLTLPGKGALSCKA